jgi:hypothetical protein
MARCASGSAAPGHVKTARARSRTVTSVTSARHGRHYCSIRRSLAMTQLTEAESKAAFSAIEAARRRENTPPQTATGPRQPHLLHAPRSGARPKSCLFPIGRKPASISPHSRQRKSERKPRYAALPRNKRNRRSRSQPRSPPDCVPPRRAGSRRRNGARSLCLFSASTRRQ